MAASWANIDATSIRIFRLVRFRGNPAGGPRLGRLTSRSATWSERVSAPVTFFFTSAGSNRWSRSQGEHGGTCGTRPRCTGCSVGFRCPEVVPVGADMAGTRAARPWLSDHPHVNGQSWPPSNTVYISTRALVIGGKETGADGGGLFSGADDRLTLTAPEASSRSHWRLPGWFYPSGSPPSLSYHRDEGRWRRGGPWAHVKSAYPGQEFVFNADGIAEADAWLHGLFDS